jgi:hypothetical protein
MKKIIFICLLISASLQAQDNLKIQNLFWGKDDIHSKTIEVPAKWKNESAVIIYKLDFYDYHKFGKNVNYTSAKRIRVKLQDEAAVKEFSEFTFTERFISSKGWAVRKGSNSIGLKVIKPNGVETIIDVSKEAVSLDSEKKIAIPNLEIGDIVDYYLHSEEPFKSILEVGFDPVETTLGDVYPIMDYKLTFQTENDFFVNFNTYNGAPKLKEIPTKSSGERIYELAASDIEKNDFPRWFYPLVELPCYKFQVFFARSGKFEERAEAFLSDKEKVVKTTVTKEDIFNYYDSKFVAEGNISQINNFLKGKTFKNDQDKIRQVYYFTRHQYFTQYVEAFVAKEANIFYPFELYPNAIFFNTEEHFIRHFMYFLKKNDISYDIVVATSRFDGDIKDLLIQKNVSILLKVNTATPMYLEFFTPFTSADQFNYNLENTKAYLLEVSKGKKIIDANMITLPGSTKNDNINKTVTKLSFQEDLTNFKVARDNSFFGHYKVSYQNDLLYFFDYVYEDYEKYGTTPLMELVKNKNKRAQYTKEFDAIIAKSKENQKKSFTNSVKEEYEIEVEDYTMELKNTGRFGKNEPLQYSETFVIKDHYIKKAGDNIIVELGKFLTSQIEISKKEKERTNNIYMTFPRQIEQEVQLEIPAGYSVSGLEKFNKKVENETGAFISTAVQEGNTIVIKTTKYYNNYYEPNSNWSKMVDFLEAAYQFTQEKILLKKL